MKDTASNLNTKPTERFSSRLGMMLAMLGMAIGTGNIWRFPRIAAQNGGGEFLIAWVVFLFMWSIPLILVEFGIGRKTRSGPTKAFIQMMGPRWAWMGAFAAFVTAAITFYYSVVAGWTLCYTFAALTGAIPESTPGQFWVAYTSSAWPIITHAVIIFLTMMVVGRGVAAIEKVAKVLMPALLCLIILLAIRAVTLPGASDGLSFMFTVDWANLSNARLWVEALTQNAWDTGAGWGLVLCYAVYLRQYEDTALNAFVLPVANNMISLLAGIMVFCTVFSVVPTLASNLATQPASLEAYPELAEAVANGQALSTDLIQETIFNQSNEGLTFIWMPQLFASIPFAPFFMVLFFLSLSFAAFTSMMAQVEVITRTLVDAGINRKKAIGWVGIGVFILGFPSAISLRVLRNQDWVWGVALILAGLFFAIAVIKNGVDRFRKEELNHENSDLQIPKWWNLIIYLLVPIEAMVLIVWFLLEAKAQDPAAWLQPFKEYNVGTVLFQFALVLVVLISANRWIVRRNTRD
jgi:NSS family neurotransmitter:Na+ symporter